MHHDLEYGSEIHKNHDKTKIGGQTKKEREKGTDFDHMVSLLMLMWWWVGLIMVVVMLGCGAQSPSQQGHKN